MVSSASAGLPFSPEAGVVGWVISLAMYGASMGQLFYYWYSYRQDRLVHRILVCALFILDSLLTVVSTNMSWKAAIICRRSSSHECQLAASPWQVVCTVFLTAVIVVIVQVFYAYRLWIITDKNVWIVSIVLTFSIVGFILGVGSNIYDLVDNTDSSVAHVVLVILVAATFVVCDTLISIFVFYFLRPARSSASRSARRIVYIGNVTVNMGFLSASLSLLLLIFYSSRSMQAYAAAPTSFIPKSYVNSAFAVLNARKPNQHPGKAEREQSTIEVPHLPTIHTSASRLDSAVDEQAEHSDAAIA